jgi:hypothetical protein
MKHHKGLPIVGTQPRYRQLQLLHHLPKFLIPSVIVRRLIDERLSHRSTTPGCHRRATAIPSDSEQPWLKRARFIPLMQMFRKPKKSLLSGILGVFTLPQQSVAKLHHALTIAVD